MKSIVKFVVAALLFAPGYALAAEAELNSAAPDFEAQDINGNKVKLSDLRGKTVVLEWLNPDCPFVQRHYREETVQKLQQEVKDKEIVWLSINSTHYTDAEKNKAWAAEHKVTWPILLDTSGAIGKSYNAKTTPHVFIIDESGKLVYRGAMDDDRDGEKEPAQRDNYVLRALKELSAGKTVSSPETQPYGCSVKYAS